MTNICAKKIRLDGYVRLRDVKGDPYMFFNLKTSELVVIPAHERSLEKRIIRLVAKKIKNGSTLEELMDMISQKFSLSRDDTEEGLAELIRKLYEAGMLRTED